MSSKIYDNINYSSDISYLTNTFIYEYDISKANINILYTKGKFYGTGCYYAPPGTKR